MTPEFLKKELFYLQRLEIPKSIELFGKRMMFLGKKKFG